jgi:hypothetical protein
MHKRLLFTAHKLSNHQKLTIIVSFHNFLVFKKLLVIKIDICCVDVHLMFSLQIFCIYYSHCSAKQKMSNPIKLQTKFCHAHTTISTYITIF